MNGGCQSLLGAGGILFALSSAGLLASAASSAPLSALEARGKELYLYGTQKLAPEPTVLLGPDSTPASARFATCASCHGEDGGGRPEGNIVPPDIGWRQLSKPQERVSANGRAHPAFSEETLAQAISLGIDPAGNRLDPIMPRYELLPDQMAALVAYLKAIEADQAPGVSPETIHIAAVMPAGGASPASAAMQGAIAAYCAELNARGGVYNRRIEVKFIAEEQPESAVAHLEALLKDRSIFAVLATIGYAQDIAQLAEREQTPMIGVEDISGVNDKVRRYGFYLLPGVPAQMRVLVDYVVKSVEKPLRAAILYPSVATADDARKAIKQQSAKHQLAPPIEQAYTAGSLDVSSTIASLDAKGIDTIFFLGSSDELIELIAAANASNFHPWLLFPGSTVAPTIFDAPRKLAEKVLFSAPMLPDDASKDGDFLALQQKYGLTKRHLAAQAVVYCAARLFAQVLKDVGRQLSHAKFLSALESVRDFDAGVMHRIAFGPRERVGSPGAYVIGVEFTPRRFKAVSDWLAPN